MTPEHFFISLQRSPPYLPLFPTRRAGGVPSLDPLRERDLVDSDVLAGVGRAQQPAQFLLGLAACAFDRTSEPLAGHAIAQSPYICCSLVDAAITAITFRH